MKRFISFLKEDKYKVSDNDWHDVDHQHPNHAKVVEAFGKLADAQRGAPEQAMLKIQHTSGGGVLSPVVEHVGDLSHRMSEMTKYGVYGREYVREKVNRGLGALNHPYGFEKEHNENMEANARLYNTENSIFGNNRYRGPNYTTEKHHALVNTALKEYANEHAKLPVYNKAQFHARGAAIAVGNKDWNTATSHLQKLKEMLDSKEGWNHHARKFRWGTDGNPREYKGDE